METNHPKFDSIPDAMEEIKNTLLVETEMEKFKCVQCSHCCLDLSDAYQTFVPETDIKQWKREQQFDILELVGPFEGLD